MTKDFHFKKITIEGSSRVMDWITLRSCHALALFCLWKYAPYPKLVRTDTNRMRKKVSC